MKRLEGNFYIDSRRLGDRNKVADKYQRDAKRIQFALDTNRDPEFTSRYYFYLGQSYRDANMPDESIVAYQKRIDYVANADVLKLLSPELYSRIAEMNQFDEEIFYSQLQIANQMIILKKPKDDIVKAIFKACKMRPSRSEGWFMLGNLFQTEGNHEMAYQYFKKCYETKPMPYDRLYVDRSITNWRALYCLLLSASKCDKKTDVESLALEMERRLDLVPADNRLAIEMQLKSLKNGKDINNILVYEPTDKPLLCMYCGYETILSSTTVNLDPDSPQAIVMSMAQMLTTKYNVYIIQNHQGFLKVQDVHYVPLTVFPQLSKTEHGIDTVIVVRYLFYMKEAIVPSKNLILWPLDHFMLPYYNGTVYNNYGREIFHDPRVTQIWSMSEYQSNKLMQYYNPPLTKMKRISPPVPKINPSNLNKKIKDLYIYTAPLNYGIDYVIDSFKKIRSKNKNAELHIYRQSFDAEVLKKQQPSVFEKFESCLKWGYIFVHYNSPLFDLQKAFETAEYWYQPNRIPEMYCATASMAAAANCKLIAPYIGCLGEQVGSTKCVALKHINEILPQAE